MEAVAAQPKPSSFWAFTVVGLAALFFALAFFLPRYLLKDIKVDPTMILGREVPQNFKTLHSLKLENGAVAEFFDEDSKHKISLVFGDPVTGATESLTGAELLESMKAFQVEKKDDPRLNPLIVRYAVAQVDPLRAENAAPEVLALDGGEIEAVRYSTVRDANYLMGMVNRAGKQVYFLTLLKGGPVDRRWVEQFVSALPR